jgi:acetyltransferase-like isoleucine patch superfamily enzyme
MLVQDAASVFDPRLDQPPGESRGVAPVYCHGPIRPSVDPSAHMGHGTFLDCRAQITIERDVMFGYRATVLTGTHDYMQFGVARHEAVLSRPVVIREGAWIGTNATICPGVTIGKHAIVAAGAVVLRNVPDYTIVAGNPARKVRKVK